MARITVPVDRPDQILPFSDDQVRALLAAAKKTMQPLRDEAILLLMLDTGVRASELCGLIVEDVDLTNYQVSIRRGR
jgi:integrase